MTLINLTGPLPLCLHLRCVLCWRKTCSEVGWLMLSAGPWDKSSSAGRWLPLLDKAGTQRFCDKWKGEMKNALFPHTNESVNLHLSMLLLHALPREAMVVAAREVIKFHLWSYLQVNDQSWCWKSKICSRNFLFIFLEKGCTLGLHVTLFEQKHYKNMQNWNAYSQ